MTDTATAAPATAARPAPPQLNHQVHVLVDEPTRAYLLGLAVLTARAEGYTKIREGVEVRDLLAEAIIARHAADTVAYAKAVKAGRLEMSNRAAIKA